MGGRSAYRKRAKPNEYERSLSAVRARTAVRTLSVLAVVLVAPGSARLGSWQAWGIQMAAAAESTPVADPISAEDRQKISQAIANQPMYAPESKITPSELKRIIEDLNVEIAARLEHNEGGGNT